MASVAAPEPSPTFFDKRSGRPCLARISGPHTVTDWVAFERTTDKKYQLIEGKYVEMAGASYEHNLMSLIEQDRASVEHFAKGEDGLWTLVGEHTSLTDSLTLTLSGATVAVPLAKIRRRVAPKAPEASTQ